MRTCHHCSKPSLSLLRCTQCKLAYYCNRTCQSAAWDAGHRSVCRRLRKRAEAMAAASFRKVDSTAVANEAWRDLTQNVQSMNCDDAYKQMCLVRDEMQRLQSFCEANKSAMDSTLVVSDASLSSAEDEPTDQVTSYEAIDTKSSMDELTSPRPGTARNNEQLSAPACKRTHFIDGSWVNEGRSCLIEFLPNVHCYQITLTYGDVTDTSSIPNSQQELALDFSLVDDINEDMGLDTSYYEIKLFQANQYTPMLLLKLPTDKSISRHATAPNYNISINNDSISIRIQLHEAVTTECTNVTDELLCSNASTFSPTTSDAEALNHLCCRTCRNPILSHTTKEPVIRSVLPLPSGFWDEITDYLICYEGQPTVEFNSSLTSAIQGVALEDDAVLILHDLDLEKEGGICELKIRGYGEYTLSNDESPFVEMGSQPWKDKSSRSDFEVKTTACAICCSTLGYVSNHDPTTHRFYKHLMSCSIPHSVPKSNMFAQNTCSSFIAREMIRYAESEAIYTFIVETDSRSTTSRCILLRMLSWDTVMSTAVTADGDAHQIKYSKVLKVIYEETANKNLHVMSDNPMEWKWGGLDLCCPPIQGKKDTSTMEMISNLNAQTKTTSVRICLSTSEWNELKHSLIERSQFFSAAVRDAFIMTKLGMLPDNSRTNASLSFLSLVT